MKWFFALNESGNGFEDYAKMLKVAVHTAGRFTDLRPHFLYDGKENDLTEWLRKRGVQIINLRSFLYDELNRIAEKKGDPNFLAIGAGAFLRTEIPRVSADLGMTDKYVLYTDVDVMFLSSVSGLSEMSPKFFAVAPEFVLSDYKMMNSGVMLMNLENLRAKDETFRNFVKSRIDTLVEDAWDQGAYRSFYRNRFFGFKWDKLPAEYNWKPYWAENSKAKIIHFHGPKPYQRTLLSSDEPPAHLKSLLPLVTKNYERLSALWDEYYAEL